MRKPLGTQVRNDFPFFKNNPQITYLDSAATSLTPISVIQEMDHYYTHFSVNIHRGVYDLSIQATNQYENIRNKVRTFTNAAKNIEVIFTKGTTESINLLAYSFANVKNELADFFPGWHKPLGAGDIILVSESEHHSNIIPWQMLAEKTGARVKYVPILPDGQLDKDYLINSNIPHRKIKIIALANVSNVTGIMHDLSDFREIASQVGAIFILDAAQGVCHEPFDLQKSGADFAAFSGHKMLGPTGIGVLMGEHNIFAKLPPFHGGGDMVDVVTKEGTTYNLPPHRFEAGTPPISQAIGLGAAIDYLSNVGMQNIQEWENDLTLYALEKLAAQDWHLFGPSFNDILSKKIKKTSVISFGSKAVHAHDIGTILNEQKVAIRAGHHCAQLLMKAWNVPSTARASLYFYNTRDDIDQLIEGLKTVKKIFKISG